MKSQIYPLKTQQEAKERAGEANTLGCNQVL